MIEASIPTFAWGTRLSANVGFAALVAYPRAGHALVLLGAYQLEPGRGMSLVTRTTLAAILAVLAPAAQAQDYVPATPPISPADMINYCVYGGLIYSVGSQICIMKGSPPLYCDQPAAAARAGGPAEGRPRASWTTSQPPATINCTNDLVTGGPARPIR